MRIPDSFGRQMSQVELFLERIQVDRFMPWNEHSLPPAPSGTILSILVIALSQRRASWEGYLPA